MKVSRYSIIIFRPNETEWMNADGDVPFYSLKKGDKIINYTEQEIYKVKDIYHDIRENPESYYYSLKVMTEFVGKVPS